jgi:hypothetical protein
MKNNITNTASSGNSPFDSIRRTDGTEVEFWLARELMPMLGYLKWERFGAKESAQVSAVCRAIISCENSGGIVSDNFTHFPKQGTRQNSTSEDWSLSRYACYLVAMNGDVTKPEVAAAQSYFAVKTLEAEAGAPRQYPQIKRSDDHEKLSFEEFMVKFGKFLDMVPNLEPNRRAFLILTAFKKGTVEDADLIEAALDELPTTGADKGCAWRTDRIDRGEWSVYDLIEKGLMPEIAKALSRYYQIEATRKQVEPVFGLTPNDADISISLAKAAILMQSCFGVDHPRMTVKKPFLSDDEFTLIMLQNHPLNS